MQLAHRSFRTILALPAGGLTPALRARSRRVILLTGLVFILSLGDLITTVLLLQSTGMEEMNPIAAYVMQSGSFWCLSLFKIGSVVLSLSMIWMLRHRWQGELAAWIAAFILVGLTWHWYVYTQHLSTIDSSLVLMHAQGFGNSLTWHN